MKIILQENNKYVLRFFKGEEVMGGLAEFMKQQNLPGVFFKGIGATSSVELAYYDPPSKNYVKKTFDETLEVLSLIGNGAIKDGQPAMHMHGTFARTDFSVIGGHVNKLVISATCEMFVSKFAAALKRELDQELNLSLLV